IVTSQSIRTGGDELASAIISYVKKEYSLMLGERTAEEIKMAIGSAFPMPDEPHAEIRGRDLVSGLPKTIVVSADEIRKAIEEPVNAVVDAVKTTLDKCPPGRSWTPGPVRAVRRSTAWGGPATRCWGRCSAPSGERPAAPARPWAACPTWGAPPRTTGACRPRTTG